MDKWDNRFIALAQHIAEWSKDPSTKVGAVLVDADRRVVSMGYNGAPRGTAEPRDGDRERKLMRTIHAEENALHFAHRDVTGCTMYISRPPCAKCAAHMIQRGVKEVVYSYDGYDYKDYMDRWKDSFAEAVSMFSESRVVIRGVSLEEFQVITIPDDKIVKLSKGDTIREMALEMGLEVTFLDGSVHDGAILGVTETRDGDLCVVYSSAKIIDRLIKDGMTEEEALEWFDFNIQGAYVGKTTPIYVQDMIFGLKYI